jgi:transposase
VPVADYVPGDHQLRILECPATNGIRTFCCHSELRADEQRQIRAGRQRRGREALERIAGVVRSGRLRAPEAIAQRVGKLLAEAKANQWYSWSIDDDGAFQYELNESREREHAALDGRFFLQTDDPHLAMADVVDAYYTLQKVEHAFREMKDFLRLRPVYHYREHRVRAHVFVCVLAYLLETALEAKLAEAALPLTARRALDKLASVHLAENDLSGKRVLTVTSPAPMAAAVVAAVGLQPLPRVVGPVSPRE